MSDNGDDHLSPRDRQIWELTYSTLERFGCLTIHKVYQGSVPARVNHLIMFMVPRGHPRAQEVKEYLEHEAKELLFVKRQPTEQGEWYPNTYVKVLLFGGIDYHLDRDLTDEMAREWATAFLDSLRDFKREGKLG